MYASITIFQIWRRLVGKVGNDRNKPLVIGEKIISHEMALAQKTIIKDNAYSFQVGRIQRYGVENLND